MENNTPTASHGRATKSPSSVVGSNRIPISHGALRQTTMDHTQSVINISSPLTTYVSSGQQQPQIAPSKPLQINLKPQPQVASEMVQQLQPVQAGLQLSDGNRFITNAGQTFLLPTSVGAAGKVFIVNSPGRPPQAIALPASFQMGSTQIQPSPQGSSQHQQKQLYVLPNAVQSAAGLAASTVVSQGLQTTPSIIANQQAVKMVGNQSMSTASPAAMGVTNAGASANQAGILPSQRSILPKPLASQPNSSQKVQGNVLLPNQTPPSRLSHFPLPAQKLAQQQLQDIQKAAVSSQPGLPASHLTSPAAAKPLTENKQIVNGLQTAASQGGTAVQRNPVMVNTQQSLNQQQLLQLIQLAQQERKAVQSQSAGVAVSSAQNRDGMTVTLQQLQQAMRSHAQGQGAGSVPAALSSDGKSVILQFATGNNNTPTNQVTTPRQLTGQQIQEIQQKLLAGKIIEQAQQIQPKMAADGRVMPSTAMSSSANSLVMTRAVNHPITPTGSNVTITTVGGTPKPNSQAAAATIGQSSSGTPTKQPMAMPSKTGQQLAQQKAMITKRIQEQLKHLSPAQKEQLLKQQQVIVVNGQQIPLAKLLQKDKPAVLEATPSKPSKASKRAAVEPEKKEEVVESKVSRRLKHCLNADQKRVVDPDYKKPFRSLEDALSRLLPYHVYYEEIPATRQGEQGDAMLETVSTQLLRKRDRLRNKYNELMQDETQRNVSSAEMVMLERIFIASEKARFEDERQQAADGTLKLPVADKPLKSDEKNKEESCSNEVSQMDCLENNPRTDLNNSHSSNDLLAFNSPQSPAIKQEPMDDLDDGRRSEVNEATLNLMADFEDEFNDEALLALQSLSSSL